jgi:hypothetical protein
MVEVEAALRAAWAANPNDSFDLIIQMSGDVAAQSAVLAERGIEVKRRLRLTHALSIRCNGKQAMALLKESWIVRVQADRPVKALGR